MRTFLFPAFAVIAFAAQAITPLTVETCKTMKTEAMRQQCMLSAVDAPPNIIGKTYSTKDVQGRGPIYIDQSAPPTPVAPITPYVNVMPGARAGQK